MDSTTTATVETPAEAPAAPQYQSIACRKSQPDDATQDPPRIGYPSAEAAAKRCKDMGYDTSDMEEHDDAYVFHQLAAPECKAAGEPEIADIEGGMKGIGCPKAAEAVAPAPADKNPYQDAPPTTGKSIATNKGDGAAGSHGSGLGEVAQVQSSQGENPKVPAGVQFIKGYWDLHDAGCGIHEEHKGILENPPVKEAAERWHEEDTARGEEMKDMLCALYPDAAKGDDADDADETDKDADADEGEMDKKKDMPPDGYETMSDTPPADDMLPGASYLAKVAAHVDAGQQMLNAGLKKQENPPVKEFAQEELDRLEARKGECKDLMTEHYPEDAKKAFAAADTVEAPPSDQTPGASVEAGKAKGGATSPSVAETNAVLLRKMISGLDALTKVIKDNAALTASPAPAAKVDHAEEPVSPELLQKLAKLKSDNAVLQKQVSDLLADGKKFQDKLASKAGVNGKKKDGCECGGTSCSCRGTKGYFSEDKTLGVTDESAGAALVKPPTTPEEAKAALEDCVQKKIAEIMNDNPQMSQEQAIAAAYAACGEKSDNPVPLLRDGADEKKTYKLYATRNGQKKLLLPGIPTDWNMNDFRIEDQDGNIFDNRIWQERQEAEEVLATL